MTNTTPEILLVEDKVKFGNPAPLKNGIPHPHDARRHLEFLTKRAGLGGLSTGGQQSCDEAHGFEVFGASIRTLCQYWHQINQSA